MAGVIYFKRSLLSFVARAPFFCWGGFVGVGSEDRCSALSFNFNLKLLCEDIFSCPVKIWKKINDCIIQYLIFFECSMKLKMCQTKNDLKFSILTFMINSRKPLNNLETYTPFIRGMNYLNRYPDRYLNREILSRVNTRSG